MKRLFIILSILFSAYMCSAQNAERENLIIAYYNTDLMFDSVDNIGEYDDDFTASGSRFWGEQRYNNKLDCLAEIIGSINGKELPDILVLAEVENDKVVKDLLSRKVFRKSEYKEYFYSSPGGKSIAILSSLAMPEGINTVDLGIEGPGSELSASIFYSSFSLADGNKYHLFINNWTDRTTGYSGSEASRINCAVTVRREVDNILNFERDARIIVLGTFNDEPTNKSVLTMLNASNKRKNLNYRDLYNPFYDIHNEEEKGTVAVNGKMQMYDFIIVSPALLKETEGFSTDFSSGKIFTGGRTEPLPTFKGDNYINGASAHFPVYIQLSRPTRK